MMKNEAQREGGLESRRNRWRMDPDAANMAA